MFYLMMIMSLIMTITFMFLKHPLSMGFNLSIQTTLISLMSSMYSYTYWFSYILFMVMLGGMLVLFIYKTSLASNKLIKFSLKLLMFMMILFICMMLMLMMIDYLMITPMFKHSNMITLMNLNKNENMYSLNMIYNTPNNMITLMLVNYLFLTLIDVVKISNINYGPLRQKF